MRVRRLWDIATLPRADIAKVAEEKSGLYNLGNICPVCLIIAANICC